MCKCGAVWTPELLRGKLWVVGTLGIYSIVVFHPNPPNEGRDGKNQGTDEQH